MAEPEQQLVQTAMEFPPYSQMRVISGPPPDSDTPKKQRKQTYQKFTDHEDLWIIKKALETKDAFKMGSKREFWRRVQDELSAITGKEYTPFDRHVTGMMKKRRDRLLKMPQDYLDWLDKWIEWHDNWTMNGRDMNIDLGPDDGTRGELTGPIGYGGDVEGEFGGYAGGGNKRRRTTQGESLEPQTLPRGPGRPPRRSAPGPGAGQGSFRIVDDVGAAHRSTLAGPSNPPPRFLPNNVSGLLDAAAADMEEQWMASSTPEHHEIDDDLNRIVDKLKQSLDRTSPRTAANSSLLIAIIGLVRDNRTKIIDLEEDIKKEQKKRKWNDDVVWSMVKNKCAELDLDYSERRRKAPAATACAAAEAEVETLPAIGQLKASTREMGNKISRLETNLRHALDEISQLRDVDRQHRAYIDGLKKLIQQRTGAGVGARANGTQGSDEPGAVDVVTLQDQVATLRSERDADKETMNHANTMLWRMEERLRSLEAPSESS